MMNRNPIIPFIAIMVFGIGLMFLLSFKGLGDAKDLAADKEGGNGEKTEQAAANPEDIYKQSCIGCHGDQYQGGVGPGLKGVGDKLTQDEIKEILVNGQGSMPPNLVPEDKAADMAEWLAGIK